MKKELQNQFSLCLVFEKTPSYKKKKNPFPLSEAVKKILYQRGFSHVFNYLRYMELKKQVIELSYSQRAELIADLFISDTNEVSDFNDYIF